MFFVYMLLCLYSSLLCLFFKFINLLDNIGVNAFEHDRFAGFALAQRHGLRKTNMPLSAWLPPI